MRLRRPRSAAWGMAKARSSARLARPSDPTPTSLSACIKSPFMGVMRGYWQLGHLGSFTETPGFAPPPRGGFAFFRPSPVVTRLVTCGDVTYLRPGSHLAQQYSPRGYFLLQPCAGSSEPFQGRIRGGRGRRPGAGGPLSRTAWGAHASGGRGPCAPARPRCSEAPRHRAPAPPARCHAAIRGPRGERHAAEAPPRPCVDREGRGGRAAPPTSAQRRCHPRSPCWRADPAWRRSPQARQTPCGDDARAPIASADGCRGIGRRSPSPPRDLGRGARPLESFAGDDRPCRERCPSTPPRGSPRPRPRSRPPCRGSRTRCGRRAPGGPSGSRASFRVPGPAASRRS